MNTFKKVQFRTEVFSFPPQQILSVLISFACQKIRLFIDSKVYRLQFWCWGANTGKNVRVIGRIYCRNFGCLHIGSNVLLFSSPSVNFVGSHKSLSIWVNRNASIRIGDGARISNSTIVSLKSIVIGRDTFIGGGTSIYDSDFHQLDAEDRLKNNGMIESKPVIIGPRAFIGAHCIILKGVAIGEGAVVGAGSVVTKDIPPFEIWAGSPARFIRRLPIPKRN